MATKHPNSANDLIKIISVPAVIMTPGNTVENYHLCLIRLTPAFHSI